PDQSVIKQAISHWTQKVPCITFVPRTTQNDYLSFFAGQGCYSWIGRTGGKQRISIGSGCANMGVIAHEIGHALGFWHEQSRPDRDSYVRILWSNIQREKFGDFKKVMGGGTNDLGVAYDFNSLMHYGPTAFAKAVGLNTIEKLNGNTDFGQTNGLSDKDIEQARLLYCQGSAAGVELFEGDIVVDAGIRNFLNSSGSGRTKRAVMSNDRQRWMINGKGVVHYQIERSNRHALGFWHEQSRPDRDNYVRINWQNIQPTVVITLVPSLPMYLPSGYCLVVCRKDNRTGGLMDWRAAQIAGRGTSERRGGEGMKRGEMPKLILLFIPTDMRYNFKKQPSHEINSRGVPYDLNSLMHYGSRAFLMRGRTGYTIIGKDGRTRLGQRYGLSASDALQANRMYCGRGPRPPTRPPPPPTPPPPGKD
ncbi:hypothetical protein QZH41_016816, partial [Actinostola sp. cb2023]